jgi:hypothetical protein
MKAKGKLAKSEYRAPQVMDYGNIRHLTVAANLSRGEDGRTTGNRRTSGA